LQNLLDGLGASERFVFDVKKLLNGKKDLKTFQSKAQNRSKKTITTEKHFAGANCAESIEGKWVTAASY
jgi:hypothetical protein